MKRRFCLLAKNGKTGITREVNVARRPNTCSKPCAFEIRNKKNEKRNEIPGNFYIAADIKKLNNLKKMKIIYSYLHFPGVFKPGDCRYIQSILFHVLPRLGDLCNAAFASVTFGSPCE